MHMRNTGGRPLTHPNELRNAEVLEVGRVTVTRVCGLPSLLTLQSLPSLSSRHTRSSFHSH